MGGQGFRRTLCHEFWFGVGGVVAGSDVSCIFMQSLCVRYIFQEFLGTDEDLDWDWENVFLWSDWVVVDDVGWLQGGKT